MKESTSAKDVAGWRTVVGAFLVLMVGFGAIYSYAAFAEEIAGTFGVGRPAVAGVFALSGGACFLVSAVSGPVSDRIGARATSGAGLLMVTAGLILTAVAPTLVFVYVGYGMLTGLGVGCIYVPAMAAVQRAFSARRGLASGIAVSGIGIGTMLVPPAAGVLSPLGDWRPAFLVSGVTVAIVGWIGTM